MDEVVHTFAAAGVQIITLAAAFLLLLGFAISSVKWVMQASSEGSSPAYSTYRMKIGRTILIGLEVLLAATILKSIVAPPTIEALALILYTVAIRTALGWTTTLEIYGRWPWQQGPESESR